MRILGTLGYQLAFLNEITWLDKSVLAVRNEVLFHLTGFFVGDKQSLLERRVPASDTIPSILAICPTLPSLGLRASKSSATLGRPPVMSWVFEACLGVLAIIDPHQFWFPRQRPPELRSVQSK